MKPATKIATAVAVVAIAGMVALAAPPVVGVASWAAERFAPTAAAPSTHAEAAVADSDSDVPEGYVDIGDGVSIPAGGPGDCTTNARISITGQGDASPTARLGGRLVEMGATELASGQTILDEEGAIIAYEVAPGDSLIMIGERFCIDYLTVGMYNHVKGSIHPGNVLFLRPDPALPWISPYAPHAAEPGSSTIPYYNTIDEFARVIAAQDAAGAHSVWERLAPDIAPDATPLIERALEESDWSLLRQLFP